MARLRAVAALALGLTIPAACSKPPAGATAAPSPTAGATASAVADFPAGTALGDLGLPVYPTPADQITVVAPETNGDGQVINTVKMDPHAPFDTVTGWYKAHMPANSYQAGGRADFALFNIGQDDDKVIRTVIIQHIAGQVQTDISLMRKTAR